MHDEKIVLWQETVSGASSGKVGPFCNITRQIVKLASTALCPMYCYTADTCAAHDATPAHTLDCQ